MIITRAAGRTARECGMMDVLSAVLVVLLLGALASGILVLVAGLGGLLLRAAPLTNTARRSSAVTQSGMRGVLPVVRRAA